MLRDLRHRLEATLWKRRGSVPGTSGSSAAKWAAIRRAIAASNGGKYGWDDAGIDERVVEYAWIFDRLGSLREGGHPVLDAGSILNHPVIIDHWQRSSFPPVSIVTLAYEGHASVSNLVRYEFGDLRQLPYRDELFSVVISISTLEHVGLDNRIYVEGSGVVAGTASASNPAAEAMRELHRVTRPGGTMLFSVPVGADSNRGWFRIFDLAALTQFIEQSTWTHVRSRFFRATEQGWREVGERDVAKAGYNEPSSRGLRTAPPYVAAAEAVALVELRRDA
jgi:SAM-dependent methyltransferase